MVFSSHEFLLLFLPIALIAHSLAICTQSIKIRNLCLIVMGVVFYSWTGLMSLIPLSAMILVAVFSGSLLFRLPVSNQKWRKVILFGALFFIIGFLSYYKYLNFVTQTISSIIDRSLPRTNLIPPLAISFVAFEMIAYLVDSYNRNIQKHTIVEFLCFATFFPRLISGPIVRYNQVSEQFRVIPELAAKHLSTGLFRFSIGLFKKVALSDELARFVSAAFSHADVATFWEAWIGTIGFGLQIYLDFSGYSDMAIGIAQMFDVSLPENFASPYRSANIQDFWRRWHITLSNVLRDYLYIPLGGSKKGPLITGRNILITFLVAGLWHGAGWGFLLWGALHGCGLIIHRYWRFLGTQVRTPLAVALTYAFVNICWVFFRAEDCSSAIEMLKSMFLLKGIQLPTFMERFRMFHMIKGISFGYTFGNTSLAVSSPLWLIMVFLFSILLVFSLKNAHYMQEKFIPSRWTAVLTGTILLHSLFSSSMGKSFMYFRF